MTTGTDRVAPSAEQTAEDVVAEILSTPMDVTTRKALFLAVALMARAAGDAKRLLSHALTGEQRRIACRVFQMALSQLAEASGTELETDIARGAL